MYVHYGDTYTYTIYTTYIDICTYITWNEEKYAEKTSRAETQIWRATEEKREVEEKQTIQVSVVVATK